MLAKLALRVCPVSGCPTVGKREGDRCPAHDRLLVREVYEHRPRTDPKLRQQFEKVLGDLGKAFGDPPG